VCSLLFVILQDAKSPPSLLFAFVGQSKRLSLHSVTVVPHVPVPCPGGLHTSTLTPIPSPGQCSALCTRCPVVFSLGGVLLTGHGFRTTSSLQLAPLLSLRLSNSLVSRKASQHKYGKWPVLLDAYFSIFVIFNFDPFIVNSYNSECKSNLLVPVADPIILDTTPSSQFLPTPQSAQLRYLPCPPQPPMVTTSHGVARNDLLESSLCPPLHGH
jgi:hypothetical protein